MARKKRRTAKKKPTKAEQIANMPIEDIVKQYSALGKKDKGMKYLQDTLRTLRTGYTRRVGQFKRRKIYSYAASQVEASIPENVKRKKINQLTYHQLLMEIARYSKFFKDVTSSVAGIEKVNREQDARIFGEDLFGNPVRRMTEEERQRYWKLYDEFINQHKIYGLPGTSDPVQKVVSNLMFGTDKTFESKTLMEKFDIIERELLKYISDENLGGSPNVYSGRGPTFQF